MLQYHTKTLILLFLGTAAVGCSGGAGGSDVVLGPGGGSTVYVPSFRADQVAPGPGTVAMEQSIAFGDAVTVGIGVTGVSNAHSASLEVTFDPNRVEFVDWACGDMFPPCNGPTLAQVTELPGRLVIGVAQTGAGPGVDVTGTATVIRLTFRAVGPGPSRLDFESSRTALGDPDLQDIPGLTWYGGQIVTD